MLKEDVPTAIAVAMIHETAVRICTLKDLAPPHFPVMTAALTTGLRGILFCN